MVQYTFFQLANLGTIVVLGLVATFYTKWMTLEQVAGVYDEVHRFTHPIFWIWLMFVSEMTCGLIFIIFFYYFKWKGEGKEDTSRITRGSRKFNPFLVLPSCIFDLIASTLGMIAFHLTYLSSLMMLGVSIIIMVAALSRIFLNRRFNIKELMGMKILAVGLVIVGLCDFYLTSDEAIIPAFYVMIGDLLALLSNAFASGFLVYQQKIYFTNYDMPVLQVVGYEGVFGFIIMSIVCTITQFTYVGTLYGHNPRHVLEDFEDVYLQMVNHKAIFLGVIVIYLINIAGNYCGMTLTKELTALTRLIICYVKIIVLWIALVACNMQPFVWQQLLGFAGILLGMFLYSDFSLYSKAKKINTSANN